MQTLVLSNPAKRILSLSHSWVGKVPDFKLLKEAFPPGQKWFKKFKVRVALGYLGSAKEDECQELMLPHKKPKKAELSAAQKQANRADVRTLLQIVEYSLLTVKLRESPRGRKAEAVQNYSNHVNAF